METTNGELDINVSMLQGEPGTTRYRFVFEGVLYDMQGPTMSSSEFTNWLAAYAAATPRCRTCEEILWPGQPLAGGQDYGSSDTRPAHFGRCVEDLDAYIGSFDDAGELV